MSGPFFDNPLVFAVFLGLAVLAYLLRTLGPRQMVAIVIGRTVPGRALVQAGAEPGRAVELRRIVEKEKTLRLFLRYEVRYSADDNSPALEEDCYGIALRGGLFVAGRPEVPIVIGTGALLPQGVSPFVGAKYGAVFRRRGGDCAVGATIFLARAEGLSPGDEVRFTGSLLLSGNVRSSRCAVFFCR